MRFLHTADWHIGKKLQGYDLLADQLAVTEQVLMIAKEQKVDGIVIAGDLYDRGVPSVDAIDMFNRQMIHWNLEERFPILAISGNHDSAIRLSTGTKWFAQTDFYLRTQMCQAFEPISIGDTQFFLLPYFEPIQARLYFEDDSLRTIQQAIVPVLEKIKTLFDPEKKHVLISHFFVSGSQRTDSETKIEVGGLDGLPGEWLLDFDYVALGHLHNKEALHQENARYSGSLLKFSLSEISQKKGVWIIDTTADTKEFFDVTPLREMQEVTGSFKELTDPTVYQAIDREAYTQIYLTDRAIIPNIMTRLRKIYPYILGIERVNGREGRAFDQRKVRKAAAPQEIAAGFFQEMTEDVLSTNQQSWLLETLQELTETDGSLCSQNH